MRGSVEVFRYDGKYCRYTGKNAFLRKIIIKHHGFVGVLISDIFDLIITVFLKSENFYCVIFDFSDIRSFFVFDTEFFPVVDLIFKLCRKLFCAVYLFILFDVAVYAYYQRNKHNKNKADIYNVYNTVCF